MKIRVPLPTKQENTSHHQETIVMLFILTELNSDGNFDKGDAYVANVCFQGQRFTAQRTIDRLLDKEILLPV
ncbi:MAG: hypothetical protein WB799_05840 [Candidatus Sulfotelmatobacter sp.]